MPALFSRHPLVLQTAYAELKRLAMEQEFLLVGTPGSVGVRVVAGREFLYRQFYDAQGRKAAEYIGSVGDPEALRRAEAVRGQIAIANGLAREARHLARLGYVRADGRIGAILAALANHGLFRAGITLVGSHAYGALLNDLGVAAAAFRTEDVDIARDRRLKLALPEEQGLLDILRASTVPLNPIPGLGRNPSTSYKPPGLDRLHVDLLVPTAGTEPGIREVPELGAHATGLPHLGYLLNDPVDTVVMARDGAIPVRVPRAERFAWHKMLVSQLRGATSEKRAKDVVQAATLVAVLAEDAPDDLALAHAALPRGTRKRAAAGARQVIESLSASGCERAVEVLRTLAR
jgi:hypothetical protein